LEMDENGGLNFKLMGISQLLSVPYAIYSKTAENGFSGNYNDLINRPILWDSTWLTIKNKPSTVTGYGITDAMTYLHPANAITSTLITNWNTAYTNRINSAIGTAPLTLIKSGTSITGSMTAANSTTNGYLTSVNWNEFNNKVSSQWVTNLLDISYSTGKVGIGTNTPNSSALLEVNSTSKGFLLPRMTTAQMNAITSPVEGLTIYNTSFKSIFTFDGTSWTSGKEGKSCGDILYEGKIYQTIIIGSQCWMAKNLNIGTLVGINTNQTNNNTIEKYCNNNSESYCNTYGGLYQWDEMMNYSTTPGIQGICPEGWHLPTDAEWTALIDYVSSQTAYRCNNTVTYIAKSLAATSNWMSSTDTCDIGNNITTNNATGFTALPAGWSQPNGIFGGTGYATYFWSSTESAGSNAWFRYLYHASNEVHRGNWGKTYGEPVRCLKD